MRIYLVTDEGLLLGKDLYRTVEAAVKGGVSMVQLREKESSTREFIERAIRLKEVLSPYGIPLIINDRVDVALAADADGVHVGQSDMPYEMVKRLLPEGKIIGLSVESPEQVLEANDYDLDYVEEKCYITAKRWSKTAKKYWKTSTLILTQRQL